MREAEFRAWLEQRRWKGEPLKQKVKVNHVRRSARAEHVLPGLGFAETTLEAVFEAGRWDDLLTRLAALKDADPDSDVVRAAVPQAPDPTGQLASMIVALRQYGYFLEGRDPNDGAVGGEDDGGEPALYIVTNLYGKVDGFDRFVERGEWTLLDDRGTNLNQLVRAMQPGDVIALRDYLPNRRDFPFEAPGKLVSAMRFRAIGKVTRQRGDGIGVDVDWHVLPEPRTWYFYTFAQAVWRPRDDDPAAQQLRAFLIEGEPQDYEWFKALWWPKTAMPKLDAKALGALRARFLEKHPGFRTFAASDSFAASEDGYKRALIERAGVIMALSAGRDDDVALGSALLDLAAGKGGLTSNLIDWRTARLADDVRVANLGVIERATGELARAEDGLEAIGRWVEELWPLLEASALEGPPCAESRTIPTMIRALVDPAGMFPIRSRPTDNAAKMLIGKWAFPARPLSVQDLSGAMALADAVMAEMRAWGWEPRDYWDVQGFLWETCQKRLSATDDETAIAETKPMMPTPENLILYGPPGTGKTWRTAREAVRLCGEAVPQDRAELMKRYNELRTDGRIEFVTFHQNYSYEEFIEGLRPYQSGDGEAAGAGFTLRPEAGVFKRFVERCQGAGTAADRNEEIDLEGRRFFKMSLGESNNPDDEWVFRTSIEGGYARFGFRNIDWSDPRFADKQQILAQAQAMNPNQVLSVQDGVVKYTHIFRNEVQPGDVLVVAKGLTAFRAIGIVEGGYEFHPGPEGQYPHRRKVSWLWHDDAGQPLETLTATDFARGTIYQLGRQSPIDVLALQSLVDKANPAGVIAAADPALPHVLIIDEINRANVSKVFGELITLIETDKRKGMENALEVRLPYSPGPFSVPANLHIVGTMNTADRSITQLDTALRRRFRFEEIAPDSALLADAQMRTGIALPAVLDAMNERIEYLLDRDHRIGHAFFIGCETRADVDAAMRDKVIPLLQEYFFEDWALLAAVLGENETSARGHKGAFLGNKPVTDPTGRGGRPRPSWWVRSRARFDAAGQVEEGTGFTLDAYDRLIKGASAGDAEETGAKPAIPGAMEDGEGAGE